MADGRAAASARRDHDTTHPADSPRPDRSAPAGARAGWTARYIDGPSPPPPAPGDGNAPRRPRCDGRAVRSGRAVQGRPPRAGLDGTAQVPYKGKPAPGLRTKA